MLIIENVRLALSSLKANKMRALLTMLGIIIGIASVIAIMTVGNSLTSSITGSMSAMGANNITVGLQQRENEEEETETGMTFGSGRNQQKAPKEEDYFTADMLEGYCETYSNEIYALSASETIGSGQIEDGNLYANVSVMGASQGYFVANDLTLLSGRFFSDRETDGGDKVAIISEKAVNNMFQGDMEKAIGSTIQTNVNESYENYTVVGVYEYEESAFTFSTSSEKDISTSVYIPLKTALDKNHKAGYTSFTVVTQAEVDSDKFAGTTESYFNTYYRNNRDFEVSATSMASLVSAMSDIMGTVTTAISVIAGIALVVGGIGVMNIMLVSITERTREIGTRKALGATNGSIRLQFIVEAIIICMIGGIIGIALGIAGGILGAQLMDSEAAISASSIIISLLFSIGIGVFFGYYPANKAAKMDPIEALRYE
ncbi:ABC transporter permease [Kineothrix sedimenti]|uniref:ABC transporter permease n=1 Tax=Kineothrix sedimenti TaxID=3123317 RepID=A0ABZ3EU31_9FIRM